MEQTPEQLQWVSNLAHWIEGGMFGVVAVMALLQAFGRANSKGAQYVWLGLVFIAGLFCRHTYCCSGDQMSLASHGRRLFEILSSASTF
ncbi:MAG: hypothetical protein ACREBG_02965 [Pyrinomonadaceae bacterium]